MFIVVLDVLDPALKSGEIPRVARVHRLSPAMSAGRNESSGAAAHLIYMTCQGPSGLFSDRFYLMATEICRRMEKDNYFRKRPMFTGEKQSRLILSWIAHHTWVRKHWGENYMHRENVFGSLIIAGLSSYS